MIPTFSLSAKRGPWSNVTFLLACWLLVAGLASCNGPTKPAATTQQAIGTQWTALFDGKTLKGWETPDWGASGKVHVKDGVIHMERGDTGTGITYTGQVPREEYEIELSAMRVEDNDFFCGLTFPVGPDQMSLIMGGWSGSVVGLSSIDSYDASENETTQTIDFDLKTWYHVRLRVTKAKIQVWLDAKRIVAVDREGKKLSIRFEVDKSVPLGICTWRTHGAVKDIRIRRLDFAEE